MHLEMSKIESLSNTDLYFHSLAHISNSRSTPFASTEKMGKLLLSCPVVNKNVPNTMHIVLCKCPLNVTGFG